MAEQKNSNGALPLNIFCRIFIPSLEKIGLIENEAAAGAVTATLEKIYQAYAPASEIIGHIGPSTGSPISGLVGECAVAKSAEELLNRETILRLKILLQRARDGRAGPAAGGG